MKSLICIGGDRRMTYTVKTLTASGYLCHTTAIFDCDKYMDLGCSTWVLPFPSEKDGKIVGTEIMADAFFCTVPQGHRIIGGMLTPYEAHASNSGYQIIDVGQSERFTALNAALTAECALGEAIMSLPCSVYDTEMLVIGYGRIGKLLAELLSRCRAKVSVCTRNPASSAMAEAAGMHTVSLSKLSLHLHKFRCIFNTVPAVLFKKSELLNLSPDTFFFELASKPGAILPQDREQIKRQYIPLPGLPGKLAPEQAGKLYAQEILRILEEVP